MGLLIGHLHFRTQLTEQFYYRTSHSGDRGGKKQENCWKQRKALSTFTQTWHISCPHVTAKESYVTKLHVPGAEMYTSLTEGTGSPMEMTGVVYSSCRKGD